ncbi:hypothetical protein Holit_00760 [Hollandina sp. SP2]
MKKYPYPKYKLFKCFGGGEQYLWYIHHTDFSSAFLWKIQYPMPRGSIPYIPDAVSKLDILTASLDTLFYITVCSISATKSFPSSRPADSQIYVPHKSFPGIKRFFQGEFKGRGKQFLCMQIKDAGSIMSQRDSVMDDPQFFRKTPFGFLPLGGGLKTYHTGSILHLALGKIVPGVTVSFYVFCQCVNNKIRARL